MVSDHMEPSPLRHANPVAGLVDRAAWLSSKLLAAAVVLRRRLSACRPVTETRLLDLLESCGKRMGIRLLPLLLVTPEEISSLRRRHVEPENRPAGIGRMPRRPRPRGFGMSWRMSWPPRSRGDLGSNWLLLAARTVHWFNPAARWVVREMQSEREAACDELAFAALEETDRSAYAATIVELAASLDSSACAWADRPLLLGSAAQSPRRAARPVLVGDAGSRTDRGRAAPWVSR